MSHLTERTEKNCLNCNAVVHGKYCHICGQENVAAKETVWHLVSHFFQDITHFDGKFFSTLSLLLFRPGFLSREYMAGRRASYLNPIRLYVFTSAFFFLIFFNVVKTGTETTGFTDKATLKEKKEALDVTLKGLKDQAALSKDSVFKTAVEGAYLKLEAKKNAYLADLSIYEVQDSLDDAKLKRRVDSLKNGTATPRRRKSGFLSFGLDEKSYPSVEAYDTVQSLLPESRRDKGWSRYWVRKMVGVYEKSVNKNAEFGTRVLEKFTHSLPQMFFISLPVYAFFLLLLYKRRKQYFYVNHAIYSIHLYCATFIFSLVVILLNKCFHWMNIDLEVLLNVLLFITVFIYQYKSMRAFYQQRRAKTIFKFILINIAMLLVILLLTMGFFLFSIWNT